MGGWSEDRAFTYDAAGSSLQIHYTMAAGAPRVTRPGTLQVSGAMVESLHVDGQLRATFEAEIVDEDLDDEGLTRWSIRTRDRYESSVERTDLIFDEVVRIERWYVDAMSGPPDRTTTYFY